MSVGEIIEAMPLDDHEVFDRQETGKISLSLLSMSNKEFTDGIGKYLISLDADLTEDTPRSNCWKMKLFSPRKPEKKKPTKQSRKSMICSSNMQQKAVRPSLPHPDQSHSKLRMMVVTPPMNGILETVRRRPERKQLHVYKTPDSYLITITASNFLGTKESKRRITINAPYWALDATDLGNGWKSFDWFGSFYDGTNTPWIFHESLGWLYREGDTVDDTWFWSEKLNGDGPDLIYPYLSPQR